MIKRIIPTSTVICVVDVILKFQLLVNILIHLGCPYNFHPERPWLRRTIRGLVATGVAAFPPLIVAGAITVLPSVGIYRFVKHIRARRHARTVATHQCLAVQELIVIKFEERLRHSELIQQINTISTTEHDFPLSIFGDMDVEHLFIEDEKATSDFQTCPTTPAITVRQDHLNINHSSTEEHV